MSSYQICADCSAPDPAWASINRGVLLCNDCCSVHRVMGTHISHIRSLSSSNWPPVLKEMVFSLVNKGANTLWEHQLLDTHSKMKIKKPNPRDKLHPTKHDFIVSKYKHLSFLPRISNKDNFNSISDMSKQLHASVRTSNLETCLRLLSLGADPNYMHTDRGNTPLHVAAQAGQGMQVELLMANGADPSRLDRLGHTSEECARIAGHHQLADRLVECQYELTDKLSNFVSGRKPLHSTGEHYLVPQVGSSTSAGMLEAQSRLKEISNALFEELAADVYDEVDRRETDSLWLTTQQLQSSIAFLPVNPTLSPLRNQGRQKLATLNAREFAQLVIDILLDTMRRQQLSVQTGERSGTVVPMSSEDNSVLYDSHDYDEVPMDENRSSPLPLPPSSPLPRPPSSPLPPPPSSPLPRTPSSPIVKPRSSLKNRPLPSINHNPTLESKPFPKEDEGVIADDYAEVNDTPSRSRHSVPAPDETSVSKDKFKQLQDENKKLFGLNQQLQTKLDELQHQLNKVVEENIHLRAQQRSPTTPPSLPQRSPTTSISLPQRSPTTPTSPLSVIMEPASLAEEQKEETYAQVDMSKKTSRSSSGSRGSLSSVGALPSPLQQTTPSSLQTSSPLHQAIPSPLQQTTPLDDVNSIPAKTTIRDRVTPPPVHETPPLRQDTPLSDSPFEDSSEPHAPLIPPSVDTVHRHIKNITQCIQELLKAAQSHQQASFKPCSLKTASAVDTLSKIFPQGSPSEIAASLREVTRAVRKLEEECALPGHARDLPYKTTVIINLAYDVAKACRHLVMCVEQAV